MYIIMHICDDSHTLLHTTGLAREHVESIGQHSDGHWDSFIGLAVHAHPALRLTVLHRLHNEL